MEVYFIQSGPGGPIKIGISWASHGRLIQLQESNPLELKLLGRRKLENGWAAAELEAELHRKLAAWRLRGEWFEPSPTVLETVREFSEPVA